MNSFKNIMENARVILKENSYDEKVIWNPLEFIAKASSKFGHNTPASKKLLEKRARLEVIRYIKEKKEFFDDAFMRLALNSSGDILRNSFNKKFGSIVSIQGTPNGNYEYIIQGSTGTNIKYLELKKFNYKNIINKMKKKLASEHLSEDSDIRLDLSFLIDFKTFEVDLNIRIDLIPSDFDIYESISLVETFKDKIDFNKELEILTLAEATSAKIKEMLQEVFK